MSRPRIGIFAHSTNPRGGVVHAMQLAEALCDLGEDATLLAPAPRGSRFFRETRCRQVLMPAATMPATSSTQDLEDLVRSRRQDITAFLRAPEAPRFDILHAQDSISALALADLAAEGRIPGFLRTVHHLDTFASRDLTAWQDEAIHRASRLFCVSRVWQGELAERFGRASVVVGNGVDTSRFTPTPDPRDSLLRRRLLPRGGRMLLALGGIEARKNTLGTLRAFLDVLQRPELADLHLVIAGGATLLDHSETRRAFDRLLGGSEHAGRVVLAGVVDDADMPSLYRNAELLCFPSLQEGFGLCVIEAMASGIPVLVPNGAPFDEYLQGGDAILVDPACDASIADGMLRALRADSIGHARRHGPARAREFDWRHVVARHRVHYDRFQPEFIEHA